MIVHIDRVRTYTGVVRGLEYQTTNPENPEEPRGELLRGDPDVVRLWAKLSNSKTTKAFSILLSFAESREELERKLQARGYTMDDLVSDIERFLFAGYRDDEIAYTMIAHDDTDNFHIHTYLANNFACTGKTLKIWYSPEELEAFRKYIDLKYGLASPDIDPEHTETISRPVGSLTWRSPRTREREAIRSEIHTFLCRAIELGYVHDRKSMVDFLNSQGLKVRRQGKNYLTVEVEGVKVRLKGGIYDEGFRAERLHEKARGRTAERVAEELERVRAVLERYYQRRTQDIQKRYSRDREALERRDREAQERAEKRPEGREVEIHPDRGSDRHGDRHGDRSGRSVEAEGTSASASMVPTIRERTQLAETIHTNTGRQTSTRPPTQIDRYLEEAMAMRKEAERLKDSIDLRKLMSYFGIPFYWGETERGEYILAPVPWRTDRHPSFIAHKKGNRWLWYDLAKHEGGSVIDFVIRFFSAEGKKVAFKEALRYLRQREKAIAQTPVRGLELHRSGTTHRIEVIDDPELMEKVREVWRLREIPPWLKLGKRTYVKHRLRTNKDGEPEGYEIEAEDSMPVLVFGSEQPLYWRAILPTQAKKGWLAPNEPIHIQGSGKRLYIVEGFTDALAIYQVNPQADILVLGTVHNVPKLNPDFLHAFPEVWIATDNDEAGIEAYQRLKKMRSDVRRYEYEGKDPMEAWLQGNIQPEPKRRRFRSAI